MYLSKAEFTVAQMKESVPVATNSGVNSALLVLNKENLLTCMGYKRLGGQRVRFWIKPKPRLNPLKSAWVTTPTPTDCTPEYH